MYRLRPATEQDVPALIEVARRSWMSAFADSAPAAFIERWKKMDREPAWYATHWRAMTVAERNGVAAGLVQPDGNEVNGLWVDPAAQGIGIGTALLRWAENEMHIAGHVAAWVTCSGYNPRALRFYERAGYSESRRSTVVLTPELSDEVVVLERSLP